MEDSTLEALGKSLASNNEWVSSGTILVQVHETIDPISEATEVDLASKIRISSSNFEFEFRIRIQHFVNCVSLYYPWNY